MHKLWRLAILLALITPSCRIEANLDLVIDEDGSGSYTSEVGFDEEIQQALSTFGDPEELLSALDFGVPGASTTERVEGDMTYSVVTSSFDDVSELTTIIQDSVDGNPFEQFEIVVDEEGARVDASIELPDKSATTNSTSSLQAAWLSTNTSNPSSSSGCSERASNSNRLIPPTTSTRAALPSCGSPGSTSPSRSPTSTASRLCLRSTTSTPCW